MNIVDIVKQDQVDARKGGRKYDGQYDGKVLSQVAKEFV